MVKKINPLIQPDQDGVYINGKYFGPANGYFENGLPAGLNGCYEGGVFKNGIYVNGRWVENATGLYKDNVRQVFENGVWVDGERQTNQFQQVLESLRLEHDPEHWASWALDGSLEEDAGRFTLNMAGGWEIVDVGPRKGVKFDGTPNAGLLYGTDEDFMWVTQNRIATIGAWIINTATGNQPILGTAPHVATVQNGFSFFNAGVIHYFDYTNATTFQRLSCQNSGVATTPVFSVWQLDGIESIPWIDGRSRNRQAITGDPRIGHTYQPMTIGGRSSATIWNAFATNHVLTDAEIYRLYVAGLNDIQIF